MIHVYKPGSPVFIKPFPDADTATFIAGTVRQVCISGEDGNVTYEVRHFNNGSPVNNWYAGYELIQPASVPPIQIGFLP